MAVSRSRAANGQGSIYQTTDGRWRGSSRSVTRSPITGSAATPLVAPRATSRPTSRGSRPRAGGPGRAPSATTSPHWLDADRARVSPATTRQRSLHVRNHLVPALGSIRLARLSPSDVERLTAAIQAKGLSARSAAISRTILRAALAVAVRDGLVGRNVAALARPPRAERREMRALTAGEVRSLLDATVDDRLGPLYALAVSTGMRQGELLGLRWEDVDLDAGQLTIRYALALDAKGGYSLRPPKTAKSRRTLALSAIGLTALRRQKVRQAAARLEVGRVWQDRHGLVFTDPVGRSLRGYDVTHAFQKTLRRLGLPVVRFHDLRHSFATLTLAAGVPLKVVSEALGHSTITLTADTYAHVLPEQRRDAADAFDRAVSA